MNDPLKIVIRPMVPGDWDAVSRIYGEGIRTGNATFETSVPSWEEWNRSHLPHSRMVAAVDGRVAGWAALSPVSNRCVYGGVAETSIYVDRLFRGKGIGSRLLEQLIERSEQNNIWTLKAGIFPENGPSIQLHENYGFRILGVQDRIGKMNGNWRDVVQLERRSTVVGID